MAKYQEFFLSYNAQNAHFWKSYIEDRFHYFSYSYEMFVKRLICISKWDYSYEDKAKKIIPSQYLDHVSY